MEKDMNIGRREIVFILLLLAAVLALRLPHTFDPLDRNEGVLAYGAGLAMSGGLPYRDVFYSGQPFCFYLYRAAFDMSGKSAEAIRIFTTLYVMLSALLIYMLARTFGRPSSAMLASFFYVIFLHNGLMRGFTSSPAVFTHFTAVFALYFLLDRDRTYESANFFIAGFLLSASVFTDAVMLPACIVPVIYILRYVKDKKRRVPGILWYLAGLACLGGLVVLWAVKNSFLAGFLDAVTVNSVKTFAWMIKNRTPGSLSAGFASFVSANLFLTAALIYSLAALFIKKQDHVNFALALTTLAVMTGVMFSADPGASGYAALVPYLSLAAAFMLKDGMDQAVKMKAAGTLAAAAMITLAAAEIFYGFFTAGFTGRAPGSAGGETALLEARAISNEITSYNARSARLFVWPNDPEIYFYTGIKAGQRIVNAANYRFYGNEFGGMVQDVYSSRPEYIVLEKGPDGKLFENLVKTYYSKALEGEKLVLYKNGGQK